MDTDITQAGTLPKSTLHRETERWLADRGIRPDFAESHGVISIPNGIGFRVNGKIGGPVLYKKCRGLAQKKFWIDPGGSNLHPWPIDTLGRSDGTDRALIITEGEIDALSWLYAGAKCVVTCPNGAPSRPGEGDIVPAQDSLFKWLWDGDQIRPEIDKFAKIILSTDGDEPGRVLAEELAVRLGRDRCWVIEYPDDYVEALGRPAKDANEVALHLGEERLQEMYERAKPIVPNKLTRIAELPSLALPDPFLSGWSALDKHLRLVLPELVIVTGTPGSGKSTWVRAWVLNLARLYGVRTAFLQFEDNVKRTIEEVNKYARTWEKSSHSAAYDGPSARRTYVDVIRKMGAGKFLDECLRLVSPEFRDEDDLDLQWLHKTIKEAATRHGCKIVVIDPWNELEHLWARNETQSTYLSRALKELKRLARIYEIVIVVVAHPDKNAGIHQNIDDMSLYSIDGGAAWNNKADHGIIIARDPQDKTLTDIKVSKSKDWLTMGEPGRIQLRFDPIKGTYASP